MKNQIGFSGRCKTHMKSFRRNIKAISPIFATLILIAIAVIAGIVVYAFVSGALGNYGQTQTGTEKISIQSASGTTSSVTLLAQQTSGPAAVPQDIIIRDAAGNAVATCSVGTVTPTLATGNTMAAGTLYTIPSGALSASLTSGSQYSATLITKAGGSFVSPSFNVP
jgi:flagellin-like protein